MAKTLCKLDNPNKLITTTQSGAKKKGPWKNNFFKKKKKPNQKRWGRKTIQDWTAPGKKNSFIA